MIKMVNIDFQNQNQNDQFNMLMYKHFFLILNFSNFFQKKSIVYIFLMNFAYYGYQVFYFISRRFLFSIE